MGFITVATPRIEIYKHRVKMIRHMNRERVHFSTNHVYEGRKLARKCDTVHKTMYICVIDSKIEIMLTYASGQFLPYYSTYINLMSW